jgi:hypothetical protein
VKELFVFFALVCYENVIFAQVYAVYLAFSERKLAQRINISKALAEGKLIGVKVTKRRKKASIIYRFSRYFGKLSERATLTLGKLTRWFGKYQYSDRKNEGKKQKNKGSVRKFIPFMHIYLAKILKKYFNLFKNMV